MVDNSPNSGADAYNPIRAETSSVNAASMRYFISNIPVSWELDNSNDFYVVAISCDGQIVENLSSAYLSYDSENGTLTIAPVFGEKDFCVYVFRNEEAINLFAIKADGNASLASVLAQFEKDNRVLKQLQALQRRNLRAPDECSILPEAVFRKGNFLSFDENGQPVCSLPTEMFEDAKTFMSDAEAVAEEEFNSHVTEKTAAFNSNYDNKITTINAAKAEAVLSATQAEIYAQGAGSAASVAAGFKSDAETSAQNAATSATVAQNAANITVQAAGVAALQLDKLNAGQLYFNGGILGCAGFANKAISLPMSIAITYDVADWTGLGSDTNNGIMFMSTRGVIYSTPAQFLGFYLAYSENKKLTFHCANADATPLLAQFEVMSTNGNNGLPTGKHTIVACVGGTLTGGRPALNLYLDGIPLTYAVIQSRMTSTDITSDRQLTIAQALNYANPNAQTCRIPIKLSRARLLNFDMSADSAPYTVADYAGGKEIPPTICNPTATQRAIIALDDYTIANGSTNYVPDISGNSYDATVTLDTDGYVKGTNDIRIKKLAQYINLQNA